jgi:tetratricopeptide (TPR) repeat protein
MIRHLSVFVLVALLTPTSVLAQDSWQGKNVMVIKSGVKFGHSVDGRFIADGELTQLTYRVLKEQNGWILVRQLGKEGWLPKTDAVPLESAISYFTDKIRQNPNDDNAYFRRGMAWDAKNELQIAVKDLSDAIRINPNEANWFYSRGIIYTNLREYQKALADDTEAIRLNPNNALYRNGRGVDYRDLKEFDKAIADFDEAIRLEPANPNYRNNRGSAYLGKKEYDRAIADFSEAIRFGPQEPDYYASRARVYRNKREYDKVIADCNETIRLAPQEPAYFVSRASAYSVKKEYAKAIADYNEAIRLAPKYAYACNSLAWILATCPDASCRDGKRAVDMAKKAFELDASSDHKDTLAAAYAELGNFEEAVRWQEQVLEDPRSRSIEGYRRRLELYRNKAAYHQE